MSSVEANAIHSHQRNYTVYANEEATLLFSSLSILISLVATSLLCCYLRANRGHDKGAFEHIVLFIGIIISVIANLSYEDESAKIYFIYEIVYIVLFGILVTWFGWYFFFAIPVSTSNIKPIGDGKTNISRFILYITVPIGLIELFLIVGYFIEGNPIEIILISCGLLQKIFQAGLYHYSLRHKIPADERHHGASWFFKIMALFNFSMWLESITVADMQGSEVVNKYLQTGYSVFTYIYAALLIDYRLLCCMLFVEHAITIDKRTSQDEQQHNEEDMRPTSTLVYDEERQAQQFKVHSSHMAGSGYMLGGILLATQLINAFQYTKYLGPWTNIFGIAAEVMVIIPGVILITRLNETKRQSQHASSEMDLVVTLMGAIGLVFWFLKGFLTICWAVRASRISIKSTDDQFEYEYLSWNSVRFTFRIISIVFQLYLFSKSEIQVYCQKEFQTRRSNHFLLASITLAMLSVVINSMIDAYSGFIEKLVKDAKLNAVIMTVYQVGAPIHLGFSVHMFLYFIIVSSKVIDVKLAFKRRNRRSIHYIDQGGQGRTSSTLYHGLDTNNDILGNDKDEDNVRLLLNDDEKKFRTV